MSGYIRRVTGVHVMPNGHSTYSEWATRLYIEDKCAGEYVTVTKTGVDGDNTISITPEEWPTLRSAIDSLIRECDKYEKVERE